VTAVVCAAFDEPTDTAVLAVREVVHAAGVELPPQPRHRPHVSLAAARVEAGSELERLVDVMSDVTGVHEPFELVLDEVGSFERGGVLWLGPPASSQLAALQQAVTSALVEAGWPAAFGQRSDPAVWIPHCTLATRLSRPRLRAVQAHVRAGYRPIRGSVDALATILVGGNGDTAHLRLG